MTGGLNRQILLTDKPVGKLGTEHFKLTEVPMPEAGDAEVLVRVLYISLDAANRAWMQGATYRSAIETNTVMAGGGLAEIVTSRAAGFEAGDLANG
jgi:NADPH-dependent curcumin reductase CurA